MEAAFSELDRRTGAKHLRVRGMTAARFCVVLKVLGMNIFRAARHRIAQNTGGRTPGNPGSAYSQLLGIIKERIWGQTVKIFRARGKNLVPAMLWPFEPQWPGQYAT